MEGMYVAAGKRSWNSGLESEVWPWIEAEICIHLSKVETITPPPENNFKEDQAIKIVF